MGPLGVVARIDTALSMAVGRTALPRIDSAAVTVGTGPMTADEQDAPAPRRKGDPSHMGGQIVETVLGRYIGQGVGQRIKEYREAGDRVFTPHMVGIEYGRR